MYLASLVAALLTASQALAAPSLEIVRRQSITAFSSSQISSFKPYAFFASAAYCSSSTTLNWSCGTNCNANPGFIPIASGGDGALVQYWYVGYDPTLQTIVVAHQGTDVTKVIPVLTDLNIILSNLDPALFPGISSSIRVHDGFKNEQQTTAHAVLAAVKQGMSQFNTNSITTVGHSLGAAISLIDSLFLHTSIPTAQIHFFGYGLPRVGNQRFANFVDANISSFTRITNRKDPVPIVPGEFLGYHHPSGEAHIDDDLSWKSCPGQDNSNPQCSVGDTPNIFVSVEADHLGPYDGVIMGCRV